MIATNESDEGRLDFVFRIVLGRLPRDAEAALMHDVLDQAVDAPAGWSQVVQLLFESIDFRYIAKGLHHEIASARIP